MAKVNVTRPYRSRVISHDSQHHGDEQLLQQSQPTQRLKQVLATVQTAESLSTLGTGENLSQPESEIQPTNRPADTLHERYPVSNLRLPDHHIDDVRSLKVIVIGAGLTGVLAGILLPVKVPKLQLTILEKNDDVVSPSRAQLASCRPVIFRSC
jgi:hypothetical protein